MQYVVLIVHKLAEKRVVDVSDRKLCQVYLNTRLIEYVSTSTPLGVQQPTAGAVLPAVHDRTEGVPDRWRSCLE